MNQTSDQEVKAARAAWIDRVRTERIKSTKYYLRLTRNTLRDYINWDYKDEELANSLSDAFPKQHCYIFFGGKNHAGYKTVREANKDRNRIAKVVDSVCFLDIEVERGSDIIDYTNYVAR